jgi:hypothetical protein
MTVSVQDMVSLELTIGVPWPDDLPWPSDVSADLGEFDWWWDFGGDKEVCMSVAPHGAIVFFYGQLGKIFQDTDRISVRQAVRILQDTLRAIAKLYGGRT